MKRFLLTLGLVGCAHRAPLPSPSMPLVATSRLEFPQRPRISEPPSPVELPAIESYRLANGLSVLVVPRPGTRGVTMRYAAGQGGVQGLDEQGWSALARRVAQRAVLESPIEVALTCRAAGTLSGSWLELDTRKEDLPSALRVLVDALAPQPIPSEVVGVAVDDQLDELHDELYYQSELARRHAHQILYGDEHPFASSLNGSLSTLKPLTVEGLGEYKALAFAPEHSALVIVGDLDAATLPAQLAQAFAALPASGRKLMGPPKAQAEPSKNVRGLLTAGRTAYVMFSYRAPAQDSADDAPFQLLSLLTGDLSASRLHQALREQGALTYSVDASVAQRRGGATFDIETQVEPESLLKALRVIDVELARLRDQLVSDDELALAKLQARESFAQRLEDDAQLVAMLGQDFTLQGRSFAEAPTDLLRKQLDAFDAVTSEQLRDVARRYLQPAQRAAAVAGPLHKFQFELGRWYEGSIDFFAPKRIADYLE
ncbi:MAG: insulinase family protein [Polyangiales bacterium]